MNLKHLNHKIMNPKDTAERLFIEHYNVIISYDDDLSQEAIVSILSIKHAIITATELSKHSINASFWHEVITELEKL